MKREAARKIIREMRNIVKNGVPHCLVFRPTGKLSKADVARLQESLNDSYRLWSQTWLLPELDNLEYLINQGTAHAATKEPR